MKPFRFYGNKNKDTTLASLSSLLDLAENDPLSHKNESSRIKIAILPTANATGDITDENSGNEGGSGTINVLPGSMLLPSASVNCERNTATEDDDKLAKKKPKKRKFMN